MGLTNRPYIGTWRLDGRELVQYTPDALVYINGDTSIPGCPKCNGRIDIQRFLTEVSVDAGTEPNSASASFSLSIPIHHHDSFARDARFILRPGLEVHVYMRGYFPVKGLYSILAEPQLDPNVTIEAGSDPRRATVLAAEQPAANFDAFRDLDTLDLSGVDQGLIDKWLLRGIKTRGFNVEQEKRARIMAASAEVLEEYWRQVYPNATVHIKSYYRTGEANEKGNHGTGGAMDFVVERNDGSGQRVPALQTWGSTRVLMAAGKIPNGGSGVYLFVGTGGIGGTAPDQAGGKKGSNAPPGGTSSIHYDIRTYGYDASGKSGDWWAWVEDRSGSTNIEATQDTLEYLRSHGRADVAAYLEAGAKGVPPDGTLPSADEVPNVNQVLGLEAMVEEETAFTRDTLDPDKVPQLATGPSLLEQQGLADQGIEDVIAHPYYHVFHGVVTEVGHSYSAGVQNISVSCSSMLHFWQFQNMSTNASIFGARPTNSKLKVSMVGHNFTGMHPYEIMYSLHYDMVGAAGGVGWAMSAKSNQAAVSEVGSESLFSLNIKYWERRFSTRMIRLRMHGASGELFSTMQTAWLGRTSSFNLTRLLRSRYGSPSSPKERKIAQEALAMGFTNPRRLEALVQAKRSRGVLNGNEPRFEINLVEMQAFVSNIGNWGQINLFESSYESKLDIANKVREITGFEFFQDVDGDYVFKPPFYNLDTSGSRVYCIEDIDLISINFSSKEPQVTYMTVKGSQFKNLQGTGTENEWGVRGQYIDYRLVAQFGWRPGSYETAYFNDPKSMFFSAVNRMDVMNVATNTATATIPERPEMRVGYPVYIRYLDCYYYCNSFAHSHSVGGQCTTTLQLVGRRAKFYAPGRTKERGISAIDLANTTLPERPLQVIGDDGKPRLSGFPNVVMALDPETINPLFFVVGLDMERIDDLKVVKWVLQIAVQERFLYFSVNPPTQTEAEAYTAKDSPVAPPAQADVGTGYYMMSDAQGNWVTFYFDESDLLGAKKKPAGADYSLAEQAKAYSDAVEAQGKTIETQKEGLADAQRDIDALQFELQQLRTELVQTPLSNSKRRDQIEKKIPQVEAKVEAAVTAKEQVAAVIEQKKREFEDDISSDESRKGIALLLYLINHTGELYRVSRPGAFKDLNSSINLLDMLSDKKATFSNGTQPGSYRYYSASHYDPAHQGQASLMYQSGGETTDDKQGAKTGAAPTVRAELVDEVWTYTDAQTDAPFPGAPRPEAQLIKRKPVAGLQVLTSNPDFPQGEVLPTDKIDELMFSVQKVTVLKREAYTRQQQTKGLGKAADSRFGKKLAYQGSPGPQVTFQGMFEENWDTEAQKASIGLLDLEYNIKSIPPNLAQLPPLPSSVTVKGKTVLMTYTIEDVNYSGNKASSFQVSYANRPSVQAFMESLSVALGRKLATAMRGWVAKIAEYAGAGDAAVEATVQGTLLQGVESSIGVGTQLTEKIRVPRKVPKSVQTFSPVFPVSDGKGYEVIGSYRYGRGLDVDADGVFQQIASQDPFSVLDKGTVEKLLRLFIQGKKKTPMKKSQKGKTTVTAPAADTPESVNQEVLRQLRDAGITDRQLLDYEGLLTTTSNPGVLQLNAANWFATGQEGPLKQPLNNAGYALGDLSPITDIQVCSCKAAEADMLLEAFGNKGFLSFGADNDSAVGESAGTQVGAWLRGQATLAMGPWQVQQDALRGQALDKGHDTVVSTAASLDDQYKAAWQQAVTGAKRVQAAGEAVGQQAEEGWDSFVRRVKRESPEVQAVEEVPIPDRDLLGEDDQEGDF